ncbi:unnamed protein product [Heterobilharzia americana]|nr:unnamed protein product [Heterobilharzia americana]
MSANLWDDSDSDDDLPAEWEQTIQGNFVVYYNRLTGFSQRIHPISGRVKRLSSALPKGWSSCVDTSGRIVYSNSETGCSTYSDPRLASALLTYPRKSNPIHQFKFDKFSSANDILLNKDLRGYYAVVTNSGCGLGLSVALHLIRHGAVVICACSKCPENAIPLFNKTKSLKEKETVLNLSVPNLVNEYSSQLFWIPYNPLKLSSIIESVQILQSQNWPLHACIITDDMLPPVTESYFLHLKRLGLSLERLIPVNVAHWFIFVFRFLKNYEIKVFKILGKILPSMWISPHSCECSPETFPSLTADGYEISIQYNYLAPALFLDELFKARSIHSSPPPSFPNSSVFDKLNLRVVIVTSEVHKDSNLQHSINQPSILKVLQLVPTSLTERIKQYANSKLCLLLFVYKYQQYMSECSKVRQASFSMPSILACTGSDPFGVNCIKRSIRNLCYWCLQNPILMLMQVVYLLSRPFGMCLDQMAANPIFCVMDKFTSMQHPTFSHSKMIPYIDKCRPSTSLLETLPTGN